MFFKIPVAPLPRVMEIYELERKTVWRCADRRNILVFVSRGSCLFEISGDKIVLSEGEALLIPAGQEYVRRPVEDAPCQFFYVHFTTETPLLPLPRRRAEEEMRENILQSEGIVSGWRNAKLPEVLYLSQKITLRDRADALHDILNKILHQRTREKHLAAFFVSLTFCEFLAELAQAAAPIAEDTLSDEEKHLPPSLRRALAYVRYNYDKKISTADLCAYCNLTPQYLIRLFKKHLGMTPLQYINKSKILHAIELLRTSELSVKEIAYTLGFDNPNYFSRLFTKEESISPAEVRERIRNFDGTESALKVK